jgi:flagellar secretion chaperone FliS
MIGKGHLAYNQTVANTTTDKSQMLLMLYDGAIKFIRFARSGIEQDDARIKGENISKALAIVTELDCALDREMDAEFIGNISMLYRYMMNRLTTANQKNDADALTEIEGILAELKDAFETASGKKRSWLSDEAGKTVSDKTGVSVAI